MARGGNKGGGRGRGGPQPRSVQVSKKLSWLLRHGAEKEGLSIGKGGYINLADVLENRNLKSLNPKTSLAEIQEIVDTNEKQRFSLVHKSLLEGGTSSEDTVLDDADPVNYFIRANQGHSIAVEEADLFTPITLEADNLPKAAVHGTRLEYWPLILKSGGLKPMVRTHIHFANGVPGPLRDAFKLDENTEWQTPGRTVADEDVEEIGGEEPAPKIISGMRGQSQVLIFLDVNKALEAGVKFWFSENGVVLTNGEEGLLKTDFFWRVIERGGKVLMKDGQVEK